MGVMYLTVRHAAEIVSTRDGELLRLTTGSCLADGHSRLAYRQGRDPISQPDQFELYARDGIVAKEWTDTVPPGNVTVPDTPHGTTGEHGGEQVGSKHVRTTFQNCTQRL
jgi:hypothetical protein